MCQQIKTKTSPQTEIGFNCDLKEALYSYFAQVRSNSVRGDLVHLLTKYGLPRRIATLHLRHLVENGELWYNSNSSDVILTKNVDEVVFKIHAHVTDYLAKLHEIIQLQHDVETSLVESVARNAGRDDIQRLKEIVAVQKDVLHSEDETKLVLRQYYDELFRIAGNTTLSLLAEQLIPLFEEGRELYLSGAFNRKALCELHRKLTGLFENKDEFGASAALRGHLVRMETYYAVQLS